MSVAIQVESLGKTYRPRNGPPTRALTDVTLRIPSGQIVGIVGASGAGKTTLLKLISGELRPTTGRANLYGHDLTKESSIAGGVARFVRTDGREGRLPDQPILLLDEPDGDLDEVESRAALSALAKVARAAQKTVALATRHVDLAREFCERIVFLEGGRVALDCSAASLRIPTWADEYRITVAGQLDDGWSEWFDGMRVIASGPASTVLTGAILDQSALHGVLAKIRDLGLPLLSVRRIELDARDVITKLCGPDSGLRPPELRRGPVRSR